MRRSLLALVRFAVPLGVLALLLAAPADAQRRRNPDRAPGDGFAQKGDAALTFSIDGLHLQPFQGGVGGRFWVSDKTVIATSLGFGIESNEADATRWSTRFSLGAERHFGSSRRVSPFVALGASVGYAEATFDDVVYYAEPCDREPCPDAYPIPVTGEDRQTSVGVAGFLGAEVRLTQALTLAAAHSLGVTYLRNATDRGWYGEGPPGCDVCEDGPIWAGPGYGATRERWSFGTGTSSLVLSIYF